MLYLLNFQQKEHKLICSKHFDQVHWWGLWWNSRSAYDIRIILPTVKLLYIQYKFQIVEQNICIYKFSSSTFITIFVVGSSSSLERGTSLYPTKAAKKKVAKEDISAPYDFRWNNINVITQACWTSWINPLISVLFLVFFVWQASCWIQSSNPSSCEKKERYKDWLYTEKS